MRFFLKNLSLILLFLTSASAAFGFAAALLKDADNQYRLPKNFRITQTIKGLHLMGSAQFSEEGLRYVIDHYPKPKYIFDFRQESHGFINGTAISWYGKNNWANLNRNEKQIDRIQSHLLKQLKLLNKVTVFTTKPNKDPIAIIPHDVLNEQELAIQNKIIYVRIPVADHQRPSDLAVDKFVRIVKQTPQDEWLYFHCRGGKGRTTSFMAMVDMMKNAKHLSFEEIIKRQYSLGGQNLQNLDPSKTYYKHAIIRIDFLKKFYNYCQQNNDNFETEWSDWLKT